MLSFTRQELQSNPSAAPSWCTTSAGGSDVSLQVLDLVARFLHSALCGLHLLGQATCGTYGCSTVLVERQRNKANYSSDVAASVRMAAAAAALMYSPCNAGSSLVRDVCRGSGNSSVDWPGLGCGEGVVAVPPSATTREAAAATTCGNWCGQSSMYLLANVLIRVWGGVCVHLLHLLSVAPFVCCTVQLLVFITTLCSDALTVFLTFMAAAIASGSHFVGYRRNITKADTRNRSSVDKEGRTPQPSRNARLVARTTGVRSHVKLSV